MVRDRYETTFDHDGLIANAGLIVVATLMSRLGLERLANEWVKTGSHAPGPKLCTLIAAMLAGATHIDHTDVLRAGATQSVLPFRVMALRRSGRSCARSRSGSSANSTPLQPDSSRTRGLRVRVPATAIW